MTKTDKIEEKVVKGLEGYQLQAELNSGHYGRVYLAKRSSNGQKVAIKFVQKSALTLKQLNNVRAEISLMARLNHPNIITLKEGVETSEYLALVMELMSGGDLFDRLEAQVSFTEDDARLILLQLAGAVKYLHERHIAHRDLKIENIMFVSPDSNEVKLGDFGLAKHIGSSLTVTPVGTPHYMAPEVVSRKHHSTGVDIWSLGCIAYILLYGSFPFFDETIGNKTIKLKEKIIEGQFSFPEGDTSVSDEAKDLISKSLTVDPQERLNIHEFLEHPWMRQPAPGRKSSALVSPENVRTSVDQQAVKEIFKLGVKTERMRAGLDASEVEKAEEGGAVPKKISLFSILASKLLLRRGAKKTLPSAQGKERKKSTASSTTSS